MVFGYRLSQALHVAAVLGISDLLAEGPRTIDDLASAANADADSLGRMLRALAAHGVYIESEDGRFSNTELSSALRADVPGSVKATAVYVGEPYYWDAWGYLLHSARTGENAFAALHGTDVWTYRSEHLDRADSFDRAMVAMTATLAGAVATAYDFSGVSTVVDIGGGHGALLETLLTTHSHLNGVLFDLPHVVDAAHTALAGSLVRGRLQLVPGDAFHSVPADADAYVLKSILHDWSDEDAEKILRVCRESMSERTVLLVVERLLEGPNKGADTKLSHLNMLVVPGGRERSEAEFAALLERAGLRLRRTVPTGSPAYVLEAVRH